jgi:putative ABC transport system substrate-binding protein
MTFEYPELSGKRLQLLKETVPRARRVLVLYDPRDASPRQGVAAAREAALEALASYGASDVNTARQSARLVDEVVRGAKAGELPVERPTRIDLVVNLKTARALGLTIPPSILVRADRVIE